MCLKKKKLPRAQIFRYFCIESRNKNSIYFTDLFENFPPQEVAYLELSNVIMRQKVALY